MEEKSIRLEKEVWKKLMLLKVEKNFKTVSDVVKYLFEKYGDKK